MKSVVAALWLSSLVASIAAAATVRQMHVEQDGAAYQVISRVHLAVAPGAAYRAATDFEQLPRFNPSIESSRRIGGHQLDSTLRLCALWYCKRMQQVMRYQLQPPTTIDMQVVPGAGDFKRGAAHWRFSAAGSGTNLYFTATLVPDFWVPPFIGPLLVRRELRQQVQTTADAIEHLAREYPMEKTP